MFHNYTKEENRQNNILFLNFDLFIENKCSKVVIEILKNDEN